MEDAVRAQESEIWVNTGHDERRPLVNAALKVAATGGNSSKTSSQHEAAW